MTDEQMIRVSWYKHDCDWITKYCDEYHVRTAMVPLSVLNDYAVSAS